MGSDKVRKKLLLNFESDILQSHLEDREFGSDIPFKMMASSALEAKINKIRQQNEEIKRRYEEVEEDKKNAAKLNALVQMVPSKDWPERKEPPEFSNLPRVNNKQKFISKDYSENNQQHYGEDSKKVHTFAQGEGPPPDPKYNFLADSEREELNFESTRENMAGRGHNRPSRGNFKRRGSGRGSIQKDNRNHLGMYRDEYQPGYEAWRAERNRIDEDRISRQRTAEGNWRREWDNDKVHMVDDVIKGDTRSMLSDFLRKDHKDFDRRPHPNANEHTSHNRGAHRAHRGSSRSFYNNGDNRFSNYEQYGHTASTSMKALSDFEERTVVATDKSIKVTLNQGNVAKGPVMSVKVNSPSIAGTGRVGPRQRTRVTYSSHSDVEVANPEVETFSQRSFEDKSKGGYFNNTQKSSNLKKFQSQKKKENGSKSPYAQRKEMKKEETNVGLVRQCESEQKSTYLRKEYKGPQKPYYTPKSPKIQKKNMKSLKSNSTDSNSSDINIYKENRDEMVLNESIPKIEKQILIVQDDVKDTITSEDIRDDIEKHNETSIQDIQSTDKPEILDETKKEIDIDEVCVEEEIQDKIQKATIDTNSVSINEEKCNATSSVSAIRDDCNNEDNTKNENNMKNMAECLSQDINDTVHDLHSDSQISLDTVQLQSIKCTSNESNNTLNDKSQPEKALNENDDQNQSIKLITDSSYNCDNVKDKVTNEKQSDIETNIETYTKDADVPENCSNPLATEMCSVIDVNEEPNFNNVVSIKEDVLLSEDSKQTDVNNKDYDEKVDTSVNNDDDKNPKKDDQVSDNEKSISNDGGNDIIIPSQITNNSILAEDQKNQEGKE